MAVSSVANVQNRLARQLVAARSAKNPFATAFASAASALTPAALSGASKAEAQQNYDQSLTTLQNKLNQLFQTAGVNTSQPIELSLSPSGTVELANSPADAPLIQQVLADHPELNGMIQSLSNAYQQLNPPSSSPGSTTPTNFMITLAGGTATASMN
ncbi:MAG TPA: hypothetical protein VMF30_06970 [Pirellulales bacterium]|nr:hypothetical protein [Pirellulales bacterium]